MPSKFEARLRALERRITPDLPPSPIIVTEGADGALYPLSFADGGPGFDGPQPEPEPIDLATLAPRTPIVRIVFYSSDNEGRVGERVPFRAA